MDHTESAPALRSWSVSALCRCIADTFDAHFNPIQVVGEVGSFVQAASGHCYFNLKDSQSQIRCAMFRRTAAELLALPANGDRIEVFARVSVHAARGDMQLVVEGVRQAGQGSTMEQFLRLKAKLEAEGLFDGARKRVLPPYPSRIGVVTSMDAAALSDVFTAMERRVPHIAVTLSPCAVQGGNAPASIIAALEALYDQCRATGEGSGSAPEVILLVRGGGAWEDLHAYNNEDLARCIASSPVPVIAGVGHETDFTIADFVADVRAATPTAAAELCAVAQGTMLDRLDGISERSQKLINSQLNASAQALDWVAAILARPDEGVRTMDIGLEQLAQKLGHSMPSRLLGANMAVNGQAQALGASFRRTMERARDALAVRGERLSAANPAQILSRGYAWLEGPRGLVTRVCDVAAGDKVDATLADGVVELAVTGVRR